MKASFGKVDANGLISKTTTIHIFAAIEKASASPFTARK